MIEKEVRTCKNCGPTLFRKNKCDGRWRCITCSTKAVTERRKKITEAVKQYKGNKCAVCGYNKCIEALEFHHLDPSKKEFGIASGNTKSLAKVKKEADKCILVCANCHREIHFKNGVPM